MPQLFVLPKQVPLTSGGALLPGAKLTFSQTGTSTPQNTYQSIDLTTPHANPVVADASGVFAPIYLDASLPDYRVKLTTSANVLIYQIDGVPAGQDTGQSYRLVSPAPELIFEETDAAANEGKWRIRANGGRLEIAIGNDAESVWTDIIRATRTGSTSELIELITPEVQFDAPSVTRQGDEIATQTTGSFTATLSGFTTTVTGSVIYSKTGNKVTLLFASNIQGTSNAISMNMTGMPSAIRPAALSVARSVPCEVVDNGTTSIGKASVSNTGITFSLGYPVAANFTTSGTKGLNQGSSLTYDITTVATP